MKLLSSLTIGLILIISALLLTGNVWAASQQISCNSYSDNFDSFNPDRWQEVLLYSVTQGAVSVDEGQMVLNAAEDQPTEIQIYALFTFEGDFDIQADYDIKYPADTASCRLNAGLVMQTLDDKTRYKCYVSKTPGNRLFFRGRLDLYDNEILEKGKKRPAVAKGTIRIVRKEGRITYLTRVNSEWVEAFAFEKPNMEKLRLRFKLQTFSDGSDKMTCPATVKFDNFKVNECHNVIVE